MVNFQTLRKYLCEHGGSSLLQEWEKTESLTDRSRKRLISICTELLVSLYGNNPSKDKRTLIATTMVTLFPFLSVVGIEILQHSQSIGTVFFDLFRPF